MNNKIHYIDGYPNHSQRGFTLLEVLITVVILSVGILGLAGLQFNSLRSNQNAAQSSFAVLQVIDAADRLRGNTIGVAKGNYNNLASGGSDPECISAGCTAEKLAQYDAWSWGEQITAELPGGQGVICLDRTPNDGTAQDQGNNGCDILKEDEEQHIFFAAKVWWDHDHNPETPRRRHAMSITP